MKAIILNQIGGIENLQYVNTAIPVLADGEVLIKVAAIGINPVDYKARTIEGTLSFLAGEQRPVILGWDVAGTVTESRSAEFVMGDEVFGMVNFPGLGKAYAEYVAAPADQLAVKPKNISHQEAAAATLAALTAWQALVSAAGIKRGDKVLIHGASGGVGHYASQIARYFGAQVIGTSSAKNRAYVLANGADIHIDYTSKDYEEEVQDVDIVLDTLGGSNIPRSIHVTKPGGKVISIVTLNLPEEYLKLAKAKEVDLSALLVKSSGKDMQAIARLLQDGSLRSHLSEIYLFEEMQKAHLQIETGRTVGKVVVVI